MRKIIYYKKSGEVEKTEAFNEENLGRINGMMTKCILKNGDIEIGFADPFKTYSNHEYSDTVSGYIYLWTWDNLDEETHKLIGDGSDKYNQTYKRVNIDDIDFIEAILYSNPRWGGLLTNKYEYLIARR